MNAAETVSRELTELILSGKSDAVRTLGVQRRTLYARLGKIEMLLSRDLDDQDTRTRLSLALHGLDLLHDRWARQAG